MCFFGLNQTSHLENFLLVMNWENCDDIISLPFHAETRHVGLTCTSFREFSRPQPAKLLEKFKGVMLDFCDPHCNYFIH